MECPNCSNQMNEVNRFGVDIDFCPACKGIWLDRGEVEKIIDSQSSNQQYYDKNYSNQRRNNDFRDETGYENGYYDKHPINRKKQGGFLKDLFDFG